MVISQPILIRHYTPPFFAITLISLFSFIIASPLLFRFSIIFQYWCRRCHYFRFWYFRRYWYYASSFVIFDISILIIFHFFIDYYFHIAFSLFFADILLPLLRWCHFLFIADYYCFHIFADYFHAADYFGFRYAFIFFAFAIFAFSFRLRHWLFWLLFADTPCCWWLLHSGRLRHNNTLSGHRICTHCIVS